MAYSKQTWNNGVTGGTPINADRLNHMEDGIEEARAAAGVSSVNGETGAVDLSGTYVQPPATPGLDFQQVLVPDSSLAEGVRWAFLSAAGLATNVKDFAATGAQRAVVGNNTLKPLSGFYGSLAGAQTAYPHVTDLSQELDWAVAQAAVNATTADFIYFPPGVYLTPGLVWKAGLRGIGAGRTASTLRSTTGDLVTVTGTEWGFYQLGFDAASGHCFTQSGNVSHAELVSCKFLQRSADKSIWKNNGFLYIDMLVLSFWQQIAIDNTVPGWDFVTTNGDVNRNTWQQGFTTYSAGAPVWKLDNTSAGSYLYDDVWRDIVFEIAVGGGIWLGGVLDPVVENCAIWDTPNATADFISIGPGTGGLASRGGSFRKLGRRSSTFTAGFNCWKTRSTSGSVVCHFEGCNGTSGGAPFTVDLNNTTGHTGISGVFNTFSNGSLNVTTAIAPVFDSFTRADGALNASVTTSGATWTAGAPLSVASNLLASNGTALAVGDVPDISRTDKRVSVTVAVMPAAATVGVRARVADDNNYYYAIVGSTGVITLAKRVAGAFTTLVTSASGLLVAGDRLALRVQGSLLVVEVNGKQVIATYDTSLTAGARAGVIFNSTESTARLDDFMVTT